MLRRLSVPRHLWSLKSSAQFSSREMKTTTLSIVSPPQTCNSPAMSEPPTPGLQHALVVDFRKADSSEGNTHFTTITNQSREYSLFLHRLRSIVQHDRRDNPRIDMVRMMRSFQLPDERTWNVLEGLRPRHFEVASSALEACDLEPLEQLNWPLESLIIVDAIGEGLEAPSKVIQYIPSLTLHYCSGLFFSPATDHSALRHLTITHNGALDMFTDLMKKFGVVNQLATLKLQSSIDFSTSYEPADFMHTLKQCTSLHSLDLNLDDVESWGYYDSKSSPPPPSLKDLPQYFPNNIEHLRFRGPRDIVDGLSVWLQCAAEPSWLPDLKTLSFELDIDTSTTTDADAHVEEFLGTLLESHPAVQIIR